MEDFLTIPVALKDRFLDRVAIAAKRLNARLVHS
jgi:hypothetical protein